MSYMIKYFPTQAEATEYRLHQDTVDPVNYYPGRWPVSGKQPVETAHGWALELREPSYQGD